MIGIDNLFNRKLAMFGRDWYHKLFIRLDYGSIHDFAWNLMLTLAIFIVPNVSRTLTRKRARRFNESVIFSRGYYAQLFHNCAQFPPLHEWILYNGRVTMHRPLIFRACHWNSISARWPTTARNSNSVSAVASINYGTDQLAGNN